MTTPQGPSVAPEARASKSIFITGAAQGIGRATALRFAREGYFVGAYDVDEEGLRTLAAEIPASVTGRLDVTDRAAFARAIEAFERSAGRMDVLFNNAGILHTGRFEDVDPEKASHMVDVNVKGVLNGIYAALPLLGRTEGSVVINMSSVAAIYGGPELAVYSATKFAVRAITEALDLEFASKGIRVCDIMPSYVATNMVHGQAFKPASMETAGIHLSAQDVAELVWKAHTRRRLHWLMRFDVKVLSRIGGLLPEVGREVMRRYSRL